MPKKIGSLTLYSVDDLHEMLGVSKMTIRAYLREGRLKGRKLGVQWYVTEEAIRSYFDVDETEQKPKPKPGKRSYKYVVQGVNDLVSETEECSTIAETLDCLNSQAIISLFQVEIRDQSTGEMIELVKARDFIDRHSNK
ncbi:helix-turn-helix domain-containing protein [Rhodohalobacter barkolensis]|uniref:DNA-binding protein n=1 Tax=Rhodohalobacter barkolensis TaxID=2053187 RepID=A0A2N0VEL7_9BACT|nr:helix-turn-helix domain-containing protein [Rhodohalobacter barkolensis]PKD42632.1 DNA-binding protein [Rhodohalobacter barkolensis]